MLNITKEDILSALTREQKIEFFEAELRKTSRLGVEEVISFLRSKDFYTAPASAKYHSNYVGGLLDHTLLMYLTARNLYSSLCTIDSTLSSRVSEDSLILSALLHDVCKVAFYVPAIKWRKDSSNNWVEYQTYDISDPFPFGHGEKSVIMLQTIGLKLDAEEMLAIRWHMTMWDNCNSGASEMSYKDAINNHPLISIIQTADYLSSLLFETKKN